jgi:diguanylate cyclase (GGDEF)-like protein/PAS domain S-box-containing protein
MSDDDQVYKTLLESTRAIPWKIDWGSGTFAYIGPQIEALLGWTPASWATVDDWAQRIHEEDRERVVNFCVAQSQSGVDHEADYRALTQNGGYVWIRDVVHVIRRLDGTVEALVGFMFDISERKKTEEELVRLQRQLEALSYKDGLTGVANRRMFDSVMDEEWTRAQRSGRPLALIMLDIDHFKQYNDHYGHLGGDECLKRVAQALSAAAVRSRDLVARFGGEEFAIVLPETDETAAHHVAERCRKLLFKEQIAHAASPLGQLLTVSMGVGSVVPGRNGEWSDFVEAVDKRLFQAKRGGRNRAVLVG